MADSQPAYETRLESVVCGRSTRQILVAAFPVASGGEVLFQLTDEGRLRRGGVYLRPANGEARAPRFDEIFRDVAAKAREPALGRALRPLVERARRVARATRPRLTPAALRGIERLAGAGAKLDRRFLDAVPGLPVDAAILTLALVFTSEEERYPRPRYRGSDIAAERVLELISRRA